MKIVYISSMLPSGHFSQILTSAIAKKGNVDLIVYSDNNLENLKIHGCGTIKNVWSRTALFVFEIFKEILKDKPDVVHIQHEFSMYGSIKNAFLFPAVVLLLRLSGSKVIVTIHACVYKKQIDNKFISLFSNKKILGLSPFTLKIFFYYTYKTISLFSHAIISHTHLLNDMLVKDWGVKKSKVYVIPTGIPLKKIQSVKKENYFLYFGYMVRRNGLNYILDGFSNFVKKNNKFKLILAGGVIEGQEQAFEEIKNYILKKKLEKNVEIKGFIEEEEQDKLFNKAYAVVIPAEVSMGSSGRLYHAQSYGKCILASDVGHFKEDITHMHDGILVNNKKWKQAFELMIKKPDLMKKIEENVKKKAKTKNSENIAKKHLEVYKKLVNVL